MRKRFIQFLHSLYNTKSMETKVKKVILFSILFLFLASTDSFPLDKIEEEFSLRYGKINTISKELKRNTSRLQTIAKDLGSINANFSSPTEVMAASVVPLELEKIAVVCLYEDQLLIISLAFNDAQLGILFNKQRKRIDGASIIINECLHRIRVMYPFLNNTAALHLVDEAKEVIYSCLYLLDKAIEAWKPN